MNYCKLCTKNIVLLLSMIRMHVAQSGLRIIGGRNALEDEYPYVVKLEVVPVNISAYSRTFCTASVLTATWTLTAAHCIQFLERYIENHRTVEHKNMIRILGSAGQHSNGNNPYNKDLFEILSHHKHPAYKGMIIDDAILIENDIGMLNTETVSLKQYAKVSAVDFSAVTGQEATAVGFGISEIISKKEKNSPPLPRPLKVLDLVVVQCPQLWHLYPAMCVAQRCGRTPTMCAGDSGGPLMHPSGIIAITSVNKARDCLVEGQERSRTVGVLTAISPYLSWITSHVISGH